MNLRIMTIEDYEQVYALWTATPGMGMRSLDDSREGIARFLARNPATCFVATQHEATAGVILCGHDGRRGYIYHTAVLPQYRGQGLARALVDAATEALRRERIHKVALVVFENNDLGNGFWAHIGFERRDDLVYRNLSLHAGNV
ncbi:MAG: GNAT family N-acetyltransferase [Oscillospiraceae bacterium]|jgi:ribosomal protein S18 acetylase RimI-like enzyme|nr:GNAT family N-acetyltransferase [Oscillospiraceae bacterium]